ncbi:MAG: DUF309 domain-containing protein [Verrucomicrobia bacterium]|nr:DUF309 domain-containing protein [Verrucomicrobiota bacterium]
MSHQSGWINQWIEKHAGQNYSAHLAGFVECFNAARFHEAHDVLEDLWLRDRHGPDGEFHKGLIQLAGAFVHLQRGRPRPAAALLKLSRGRIAAYPEGHLGMDTRLVRGVIDDWLEALAAAERGGGQAWAFPQLRFGTLTLGPSRPIVAP